MNETKTIYVGLIVDPNDGSNSAAKEFNTREDAVVWCDAKALPWDVKKIIPETVPVEYSVALRPKFGS